MNAQTTAASSPIERMGHRFEESKALQSLFASLNHLPLPYDRMSVQVNGHHMYAHTFDRFVALWLWKVFGLEAAESELLGNLVRPGMQVIDIGSNVGLHTLELARLVGPEGRVYAFEADRGNYGVLSRNIRENFYEQIEALHAAVGATSGETFVFKSGANCGDHRIFDAGSAREKEAVRMLALDDFVPPGRRVDFIKMDIQGAEGYALKGMHRVLRENAGLNMVVECWPYGLKQAGFDPAEVLREIQELGFALEVIDERPESERQIPDATAFLATLTPDQYLNLLARKN